MSKSTQKLPSYTAPNGQTWESTSVTIHLDGYENYLLSEVTFQNNSDKRSECKSIIQQRLKGESDKK